MAFNIFYTLVSTYLSNLAFLTMTSPTNSTVGPNMPRLFHSSWPEHLLLIWNNFYPNCLSCLKNFIFQGTL